MQAVSTLTRIDLDYAMAHMADGPGMALRLYPSCHPRATIEAEYTGDGTVALLCHRCQRIFTRLAISRVRKENRR